MPTVSIHRCFVSLREFTDMQADLCRAILLAQIVAPLNRDTPVVPKLPIAECSRIFGLQK